MHLFLIKVAFMHKHLNDSDLLKRFIYMYA